MSPSLVFSKASVEEEHEVQIIATIMSIQEFMTCWRNHHRIIHSDRVSVDHLKESQFIDECHVVEFIKRQSPMGSDLITRILQSGSAYLFQRHVACSFTYGLK